MNRGSSRSGSGKLLANGTTQQMEVQTGDKVLIAKYAGSDVNPVEEPLR